MRMAKSSHLGLATGMSKADKGGGGQQCGAKVEVARHRDVDPGGVSPDGCGVRRIGRSRG